MAQKTPYRIIEIHPDDFYHGTVTHEEIIGKVAMFESDLECQQGVEPGYVSGSAYIEGWESFFFFAVKIEDLQGNPYKPLW